MKRKLPPLTPAELRIMRALWRTSASTVSSVVEAVGSPRLARTTVMTMLGILERKEYVSHTVDGRTYVYRPLVAPDDVRTRAVEDVVSRFFDDSPKALVLQLLGSTRISKADLDDVRHLIERRK